MKWILFVVICLSLSSNTFATQPKTNSPKNTQIPTTFSPAYSIDGVLLDLNMQMKKIITEVKSTEKRKFSHAQKESVKAYLKALESAPKEEVYSSEVNFILKTLTEICFITQQEYNTYSNQRYEYFLQLNMPFREYIKGKMERLEDLSEEEFELAKKMEWYGRKDELLDKIKAYYYQQFQTRPYLKEEWLRFMIRGNNQPPEQISPKELDFVREYFEPLYTNGKLTTSELTGRTFIDNEDILCIDSEGPRVCRYKLKKPLRLKGTLRAITRYDRGSCEEEMMIVWFEPKELQNLSLKPSDKELLFYILRQVYLENGYKIVESKLPQWFKDGISGEVSFEAEITLNTILVNWSACSNGDSIEVEQVEILKQIQEKKYDRDTYAFRLKFKTKDSYVNLRQSPNGKILARIEIEDSEERVFWVVQDNAASQWFKVIYFPPHKNKARDAILGYIHKSQVLENWVFVDRTFVF